MREVPLNLARAGEARHFIAWRGAVITDVLLSAREGVLEIESVHDEEVIRVSIAHPEIEQRRFKNLDRVLERFLDDCEITPTHAMLEKRLR